MVFNCTQFSTRNVRVLLIAWSSGYSVNELYQQELDYLEFTINFVSYSLLSEFVFLNNGKLKLGIKTTRFYGHYIYFDLKNLREYNTLIKPTALFQFDKSINQLKGLIKKDRFNNKILNILYKLGISDKPIYTKNRIFDNSTFILRDDVLKSPLWYLFKYFGKS